MNIPSSCNINIDNTKLLDGASNVLLLEANVKVECNTTSAIVKLINKNLEEFKNHVEMQRKESLANALSALTKANSVLENTFNLEEEEK